MDDSPANPLPAATTNSLKRPRTAKQICILSIVAVVLYIGWHGAMRGWELQRRFVCGRNLRGVQNAMAIYAGSGWDGRGSFSDWLVARTPAAKEWTRCPSGGPFQTVQLAGGWPSDDDTVVAYEPKSNHKDEGGFVAYSGGSVRFVPVPEYDQLIDKIKASRPESTP